MPNTAYNEIVQDHRVLNEWSMVSDSSDDDDLNHLPIDMRFNEGHRLSIAVYSVLMVISSIANITVLILLIKQRLRGPSRRLDVMLMHLAIADLLVTFLMMPLEIGWAVTVSWKAGDFLCRGMAFFRIFGLYLSSFVLVCISVDRYFAVLKPLMLSDTRGRIFLSVAWISSCIFSTPQAIIFHLETHPNITKYKQCVTYNFFENEFHMILYSVIGMILMYALPLIIIIFCYASIYFEIYRKSRKAITERFRRSNDDVLGRAKRRTLRMTITIVIVFVVCWTPFYVMSVWYWLDRETAFKVDQRIQKGLFLFACTNSCMNPLVYGAFNIRAKKRKFNTTLTNHIHSIPKRIEDREAGSGRPSIGSFSVVNTSGAVTPTITSKLSSLEKPPKYIKNNNDIAKKTICMSCGESIELSNLRIHHSHH